MNLFELQSNIKKVSPAITIDSISTYPVRKKIRNVLFYSFTIFFFIDVLSVLSHFDIVFLKGVSAIMDPYVYIAQVLFLISISVWIFMYAIEIMYLHYYFLETGIDYEVVKMLSLVPKRDVAYGFLHSELGQFILLRCGITPSQISDFLKNRKNFVDRGEFVLLSEEGVGKITLIDFTKTVLHFDSEFKDFLKRNNVSPDVFLGSVSWVSRIREISRNSDRWWTKENLSRIPSLGSNLSFGKTYFLDKYGHSIFSENAYRNLGTKWRIFKNPVNAMELVLVKSSGANVMLISEDIDTGMMLVSGFAKEIFFGTVLPELESKRVFVLDPSKILDTIKDQKQFEKEFRKTLSEASSVGNIILVINNMSSFVETAFERNINVKAILSEALENSDLQVVALANRSGFHSDIETDIGLMKHFEKIFVEDLNKVEVMNMLQEEVIFLENKYDVFFTYQSLNAILEGAEKYFSEGSLSDKSFDILYEITPIVYRNNRHVVRLEDIDEFLKDKTGIPQGEISSEEKEVLKNIEEDIHKKIIGQDSAVNAIANALRRSRAGLTKNNKPIASFLFFGPTGVGKTEVAKALSEKFFSSDEALIRFDMSEYSDEDSVKRLIGSKDGAPGILSSRLRERQYGVLLLDEFEKASVKVHDLFLQIIDEGMFSDGDGNPVNARNVIIIATSNAGSNLISQTKDEYSNSEENKREIVNKIMEDGIFKPELINRFDEVVLFHRLEKEHLQMIARIMISDLNKRLQDKSITVRSNEQIIDFIIDKSYDPKFGARNMNRFIQDTIEKAIADAIIEGTVSSGDSVYFSVKEDKMYLHKDAVNIH